MSIQNDSPPQYTPSLQQQQQQQHTPSQEPFFKVFTPELDSVAHTGIFIQTDPSLGTGTMFQVTGDVISQNGMRYEERVDYLPGSEAPLHRSTPIGVILKSDFDRGIVSTIVSSLPTPSKQQGLNFWEKDPQTGRHELIWTKENGDPYGPGETRKPTFKCNEWTSQYAVPALRDAGVLRDSM
jgi:hypothetical protein